MKSRELIGEGPYGPETLKVLYQVFDDAWNSIAADFGDNPLAIGAARLKLANAILSLATEGTRNAKQLKTAALEIMARE